jgi:hypothetical protein
MNCDFLLELKKLLLKNCLLLFGNHLAFLGFIDLRRHTGQWVVTGFFDLLFLDFFELFHFIQVVTKRIIPDFPH